ncbi:MAG: 1,4-dihydroxy-2-naphthoate polyprenyltransferase [Actinomycetes bacterium]
MTALGLWLAGARPRTLPAAVAPVAVGTGVAAYESSMLVGRAGLALVVALSLQVGVNYANDYSDGIRGTDNERVGPIRLVGQQLASPRAVKSAALLSFAVAAVAGLALVILTGAWWLLAVGAACIAAAWLYTGGSRPYGYAGFGEVFVFVFFGLVASAGTTFVQTGTAPRMSWLAATAVGLPIVAILVANNLRDIPGDTVSGKKTLAVRLGDHRTRLLYQVLIALTCLLTLLIAGLGPRKAVVALLALVGLVPALRTLRSGAIGRDLIPVLAGTGRFVLVFGLLLGLGLSWGTWTAGPRPRPSSSGIPGISIVARVNTLSEQGGTCGGIPMPVRLPRLTRPLHIDSIISCPSGLETGASDILIRRNARTTKLLDGFSAALAVADAPRTAGACLAMLPNVWPFVALIQGQQFRLAMPLNGCGGPQTSATAAFAAVFQLAHQEPTPTNGVSAVNSARPCGVADVTAMVATDLTVRVVNTSATACSISGSPAVGLKVAKTERDIPGWTTYVLQPGQGIVQQNYVRPDQTACTQPIPTGTGGTPTWTVNVGGVTLHPTGSAQQIRQVEGCAVVVAQASSSWR